ncbi:MULTISPECIES: hypothetical protein [unclassified Exiguobacterium]|uniref:hypothetical protein n=1 Tax=unclassified Exiguobacterium TaxID=2644629 RepID=UPI001BE9A057|nr:MULTISPECIES: hypothetical protein [unclassified Exiguobacterium]
MKERDVQTSQTRERNRIIRDRRDVVTQTLMSISGNRPSAFFVDKQKAMALYKYHSFR